MYIPRAKPENTPSRDKQRRGVEYSIGGINTQTEGYVLQLGSCPEYTPPTAREVFTSWLNLLSVAKTVRWALIAGACVTAVVCGEKKPQPMSMSTHGVRLRGLVAWVPTYSTLHGGDHVNINVAGFGRLGTM